MKATQGHPRNQIEFLPDPFTPTSQHQRPKEAPNLKKQLLLLARLNLSQGPEPGQILAGLLNSEFKSSAAVASTPL
jgi:hypothetical protein